MEKKPIAWLNGAKFLAIIAVMVDHTNGILYSNPAVAYASYYSVSLFVLLLGMTAYLSSSKNGGGGQASYRGIKKMLVAYSIAVVVYLLVATHGFDLAIYLTYLVNFNISGPHYFVLLYVQLMLVNVLLFPLLQKCPQSQKGYVCEVLILIGIIILSAWTTNHTNILNVYGGGGKLFGGTYLILFYVGMLVMKHGWLERITIAKSMVSLLASGGFLFLLWRYTCAHGLVLDSYVPFGGGKNPPSITFMTFGLCMLFIAYGMFTLLERIPYTSKVALRICDLGRHSLYIFLYHRLILDYYLWRHMADLPGQNIWLARAVYFLLMIAGAIFIEVCIGYMKSTVQWVLRG